MAVAEVVDEVPPKVEDDEDVDKVVVVPEVVAELPIAALEGVKGAAGPTEDELEEFSRSSCCTCRMSTYSSRLAFGLARFVIPGP